MFDVDFKQMAGWVIACLVSILSWFFSRAVKRMDHDIEVHSQKITELEALKADIMLRPAVEALYHDQKREFQQRFLELRQDQKEDKAEMLEELRLIRTTLSNMANRTHNQRSGDS